MASKLVEINNEDENDVVVHMANDAKLGDDDGLDYWIGLVETADGWKWLNGGALEWAGGWWGEGPDGEGMGGLVGGCVQLGRIMGTKPNTLDNFYWARAATDVACTNNHDTDNGIICEMEGGL